MIIILMGVSGSGKTTIGGKLRTPAEIAAEIRRRLGL
jgi:adenylate kinase family enzyme